MSDYKPSLQELDKLAAEAESARALARKSNAEARKAEVEAQRAELTFAAERASDTANHVYQFSGTVDSSSCNACIARLSEWHRVAPGCDITIVFNSPGGSVFAGMALWDFLETLKASGHTLTTVARGMAASMGGILLQAGTHRVCGRESYILVHEISTGAIGKISELSDEVEFAKRMTERVLDIFVARTKLTKAQIKKRMFKTDWWLDSREALELGFVDEVL